MKMENEVFKDVAGYEGIYQVSNLGRVKRFFQNRKAHLLKPQPCGAGYLFVVLCKNGIVKQFLVHRLVATTFIPNPGKLPEVNHKDEIKTNNCVDNLEWCTRKYNVNYGTRNQKMSEALNRPDVKKQCSEAIKCLKWFNNGIKQVRARECPEGYGPGRLKRGPQAKSTMSDAAS